MYVISLRINNNYLSYLIDYAAIICELSCDFDNRIFANGKWHSRLLRCHLRFFSEIVLR